MAHKHHTGPEDNLNEDYEDLKEQILSCYSSYLEHAFHTSTAQWRPSTQALKNL